MRLDAQGCYHVHASYRQLMTRLHFNRGLMI